MVWVLTLGPRGCERNVWKTWLSYFQCGLERFRVNHGWSDCPKLRLRDSKGTPLNATIPCPTQLKLKVWGKMPLIVIIPTVPRPLVRDRPLPSVLRGRRVCARYLHPRRWGRGRQKWAGLQPDPGDHDRLRRGRFDWRQWAAGSHLRFWRRL